LAAGVSRVTFHPDGSIVGAALERDASFVIDTRSRRVIQTQTHDAHGPR